MKQHLQVARVRLERLFHGACCQPESPAGRLGNSPAATPALLPMARSWCHRAVLQSWRLPAIHDGFDLAPNAPPQDVLPGTTAAGRIQELADAITTYGGKVQAQREQATEAGKFLEATKANVQP